MRYSNSSVADTSKTAIILKIIFAGNLDFTSGRLCFIVWFILYELILVSLALLKTIPYINNTLARLCVQMLVCGLYCSVALFCCSCSLVVEMARVLVE